MARLKQYFENLPDDKRTLAYKLCDQATFMESTLRKLQRQIRKDGPVITTKNGNGFETVQEHPAQKSYNAMINRYSTTITKLTEMLPRSSEDIDEFTEFVNRK